MACDLSMLQVTDVKVDCSDAGLSVIRINRLFTLLFRTYSYALLHGAQRPASTFGLDELFCSYVRQGVNLSLVFMRLRISIAESLQCRVV